MLWVTTYSRNIHKPVTVCPCLTYIYVSYKAILLPSEGTKVLVNMCTTSHTELAVVGCSEPKLYSCCVVSDLTLVFTRITTGAGREASIKAELHPVTFIPSLHCKENCDFAIPLLE